MEVCWGGQGPSCTIVPECLFCHGCGGTLAGGVGVLSKESQEDSQEDSQEVVCGLTGCQQGEPQKNHSDDIENGHGQI